EHWRGRGEEEAEGVEAPAGAGRVVVVQRQVVAPRAQVDVVRVGLPHDAHAERVAVEAGREADVAHLEGQVTEPAHGRHAHAAPSSRLLPAAEAAAPARRAGEGARAAALAHLEPGAAE